MLPEDIIESLETAYNLYEGPQEEDVREAIKQAIQIIRNNINLDNEDIDWQDPTAIYLEGS